MLLAGLATISAQVQRSGGSVQHDGQQLDEELDQVAAVIESFAAGDASAMGMIIVILFCS